MTATRTPDKAGAGGAGTLHAGLTRRQISMMGLGGAIGAGLFVGSGQAISMAGPAVLVSYLVAGTVVILVMSALAEMVAANPSAGSFSAFAQQAFGRPTGGAVGWLYWIQLVVVVAAEATGAAEIVAGYVPAVPQWAWVLLFVVALTAVNLLGVNNYGRFEYWFSFIKVAAIVVFLAVGVAAILGLVPGVPGTGLSHLSDHGGFAPTGWAGMAAAVLIVLFSFGGTEVVSIAAAESDDPRRNIKDTVRQVMVRILVFYIGSLLVIIAVLPWDSSSVATGPFAAVLATLHVPGVDLLMSAVVVVALLSAMNTNIYGASRMIFSLGRRRLAPVALSRVYGGGVPRAAVLASVAFCVVSVLLNLVLPDVVLPLLLNVVGSTVLVLWCFIVASQMMLRLRADRSGTVLPLRMWAFPWLTGLAMVLLLAMLGLAMTDTSARNQLLLTLGLTVVLGVLVALTGRRRTPDGMAGEAQDDVKDGAPADVA